MANINPELDLLKAKLMQRPLPPELMQRAERMLSRLSALEQMSNFSLQELEIVSKYIDWICAMPFGTYTHDNLDIEHAKQLLDKNHFGLVGIKENILEFIASKALIQQQIASAQATATTAQTAVTQVRVAGGADMSAAQNNAVSMIGQPTNIANTLVSTNSAQPGASLISAAPKHILSSTPGGGVPTLCFVGVQGVGKTTMAKSIAESLGRSFQKIALGAFASVHEIRGKSRSETGAEPGQIIKALVKSRSMNPVILLDEIDKVSDSSGLRSDIMAALLEILDPEQNREFMDRYLDYPVDLSQVMFITTANNLNGLSSALIDRLELIRFTSYSDEEKQHIAQHYLLPKVRSRSGITAAQLDFSEDVWPLLIRPLGFDPGIRQLERNLTTLSRKVAKLIVSKPGLGKIVITPENFRDFFPEQIAVYS